MGLIISSLYLVWTIAIKTHVNSVAENSLQSQNLKVNNMISGPAPFNTVLWRVVGMQDTGYVEGFYSIFDKNLIQFNKYSSQDSLIKPIEKEWSIKRLKWFTKGFYKVSRDSNKIIMTDIRMGLEPSYFFNFSVGEIKDGQIIAGRNDKLPPLQFDITNSLILLWNRIWDEENIKLNSE